MQQSGEKFNKYWKLETKNFKNKDYSGLTILYYYISIRYTKRKFQPKIEERKMQKSFRKWIAVTVCLLFFAVSLNSCGLPTDFGNPTKYNTEKYGLTFGAIGAGLGQIIGHNTISTLIGFGSALLVGGLYGYAVDQRYENQAAQMAATYNRPVVLSDNKNNAVVAIPDRAYTANNGLRCKVTTIEIWNNKRLVKKTFKKVCNGVVMETYEKPSG